MSTLGLQLAALHCSTSLLLKARLSNWEFLARRGGGYLVSERGQIGADDRIKGGDDGDGKKGTLFHS